MHLAQPARGLRVMQNFALVRSWRLVEIVSFRIELDRQRTVRRCKTFFSFLEVFHLIQNLFDYSFQFTHLRL